MGGSGDVAGHAPGPPLPSPAMRTLASLLAAASLSSAAARAAAQPIGIIDQRQYGTSAFRNDHRGTAAGQKVSFKIGTVKVGQKVMFEMTVKGSKTGELIVKSLTTATETREVRNDEQVNYVD